MFRAKFTFNEEAPPTQQYQQQWQGGPMQPYVNNGNMPSVFGQSQPVRHQAGDERYVRTVSFTETSTNDTGISLQKAADRQVNQGNNSTTVNLLIGLVFAAVAGKAFFSLVERSIEVFAALVLGSFLIGFFMLRGQIEKKRGG